MSALELGVCCADLPMFANRLAPEAGLELEAPCVVAVEVPRLGKRLGAAVAAAEAADEDGV